MILTETCLKTKHLKSQSHHQGANGLKTTQCKWLQIRDMKLVDVLMYLLICSIMLLLPIGHIDYIAFIFSSTLQWRHNEWDGVSNHQRHDCLLNRLFRHRSNKTSKLRVTGLCEGIHRWLCEFPAQRASNAENVSIWWCHRGTVP